MAIPRLRRDSQPRVIASRSGPTRWPEMRLRIASGSSSTRFRRPVRLGFIEANCCLTQRLTSNPKTLRFAQAVRSASALGEEAK